MNDKRLTLRLTEYWDSLRKGQPLPLWKNFDTVGFSDIWRQCCGWHMTEGKDHTIVFTYDHVGESLKPIVAPKLAGKQFITSSRELPGTPMTRNIVGARLAEQIYLTDFGDFPVASIIKKIDRVINKHVPLVDEGTFQNAEKKTVKYRSCLLPFGNAKGAVSNIVLGLSWKID